MFYHPKTQDIPVYGFPSNGNTNNIPSSLGKFVSPIKPLMLFEIHCQHTVRWSIKTMSFFNAEGTVCFSSNLGFANHM